MTIERSTGSQTASNRFAGSTARAPQLELGGGLYRCLCWWKRSVLRDVVVALTLLAAVGAVLSVGSFVLELIGFH